jgi:acyl carrier protein
MEKDEIIERTRRIVSRVLKDDHFKWNDELTAADINGWDSLSHIFIITEIENEFSVKFKLKELNRINDLGSLISLIKSKL